MRIVIAEDSAVVRAGLAEILTDSGHQVLAAVGNAGDLLAAVSFPQVLFAGDEHLVGPLGPYGADEALSDRIARRERAAVLAASSVDGGG